MEKIKIAQNVRLEIDNFITLFFESGYFSFIENAEHYVNNTYDFIFTIPSLIFKQTKNNRFGNFYCSYKANSNTNWYIIFDIVDDYYFIRFITNNHSQNYPIYIIG